MSVSRRLSAAVRPLFFGIASVVALASAPVLAQSAGSAPPVVQSPAARGATRGPAAGAPGLAGARGGRGHGHHGRHFDPSATPEQRFEQHVQHMIGRLGLDATQAAQVRQIMTEGRAQHEALASERLTGEQAMARHRALMEANGQRIRALLRPDQQRVFDFHASRMREAGDRMRRGGGPGHGPMGDRIRGHIRGMMDSLSLDATQRAAVERIFEEGRAQHEALRAQAMTGEERRARHRAIMEANGQRIRALLRADQQAIFDQQVTQLRQRFEAHRGGPGAAPAGRAPAAGATQPQGGI